MNKFFLIFFFFLSNLYSQSEQIVFVLSQKYSSQKAKLIRYEKIDDDFLQISKPIEVNIGEKGLAWGLSPLIDFQVKNMILKKEGDKKAVAGVFKLSKVYTYHKNINTKMPYINTTKNHICVDDINSEFYNQVINVKDKSKYKSYENMLLSNETYEYVIQVEHNTQGEKAFGSCIFIHVENPTKNQTTGCTSLKKNHIIDLLSWLDIKKEPLLIQIPKQECQTLKKEYSFLNCNI